MCHLRRNRPRNEWLGEFLSWCPQLEAVGHLCRFGSDRPRSEWLDQLTGRGSDLRPITSEQNDTSSRSHEDYQPGDRGSSGSSERVGVSEHQSRPGCTPKLEQQG